MSPLLSMMGLSSQKTIWAFFAMMLVLAGIAAAGPAEAQGSPEKRIAFVVGNAAYKAGALPTPANDAGLIAQTLQAAGFDVIGARDLDQNGLRDAMRDFLTKANASGPDTVVFVYLAGYGVQYQGDNYFVPVDAQIANATDVPVEALRMTDFAKSLAAINNRGSIIVLDAARANPFVQSNQPLAGGLALVDPDANQLIAFNAAPGTVAPQEAGPYGSYAHALAEMIRVGGLPLGDVFDRTRLRVSDLTKGAQISWDASKFKNAFTFFDRGPDAPAAQASGYDNAAIRTKAIRDFDERDAYFAALDRDTLQGYEDFLAAYPNDSMARRVRAIIAARREAITWRETWIADTPEAYWSYLRRYPRGPHVWDARRRLEHFEAALEPPPSFAVIEYDVPPPPPPEVVYVDRPVLYFDDAHFGYAPSAPVVFLAPQPPDFVVLAPPQPSVDVYVLPAPVFVPVPQWVEPPRDIAPPENNVIFNNIHNTVVNNTTVINNNTVVNENGAAPAAPGLTTGQKLAGAAVIAGAGTAALHVALPPSVQKKAAVLQKQNPPAAVKAAPGAAPAVAPSAQPRAGNAAAHALPGTNVQPLPTGGKLPGNPGTAQTKQAQPLQAAPNAVHNPAAAAQPTQQGTNANAHALPGANGQPLPATGKLSVNPGAAQTKQAQQPQTAPNANVHALPGSKGQPLPAVGNAPAVKGQNQIAKTPAPQAAPSGKPNPVAVAPKPSAHASVPPAIAARTPAKPKAVTGSQPRVNSQPHVAAVPPWQANPAAEQRKPAPHVVAQARAPAPKPQAQPRPQPQPKVVQQQVKRPPPPPPQKPPEKKKCGAPGLPACH
ncbi:peptidase C14 caspase catalytic subunit p20 [Rhizobium tropici]|uniref:Peptidase C14 caspase catalytic subunit p20 n=1 Tax=Rhizobium tropici TaxID=398 RepID=A0A5B0VVR8_RHITR|nr:caspase domain-containing protein [Rhizobium tropici]KAA1178627.1 peptidase C14 caspase catalytic subunit p20 [Rhizobium tropici]